MERNNVFWSIQEGKIETLQNKWFKEEILKDKESMELDYQGNSEMDAGIERAFGHQLLLAGPLVDRYLQHIGQMIYKKLLQKHLTGYTQTYREFIPNEIFKIMLRYFAAYGCELHDVFPKRRQPTAQPKKKIRKANKNVPPSKSFIWITSKKVSRRLFAPERFDGTNYLAKRVFRRKKIQGRRQKLVYDGKAIVAITSETPIKMVFEYKTSQIMIGFTIQRYNENGEAIDSTVQAQINSAETN
ncbi:uncharacterized protein [Clytia hemisphaerica]|uniref:uncharacterized protein n=1 Tax=Clytia hemisphaerica TaxID=252671 RepID=UPI0034D612EE